MLFFSDIDPSFHLSIYPHLIRLRSYINRWAEFFEEIALPWRIENALSYILLYHLPIIIVIDGLVHWNKISSQFYFMPLQLTTKSLFVIYPLPYCVC